MIDGLFLISKLNVLMKFVDVIEGKKIKVRTFKNTINYNKHHEKRIPDF